MAEITIDHDQRFKEMLREFLKELLALFLPWLVVRMATSEVNWQSQELFTNPPFGLVRRVDLLGIVKERLDEEKIRERVLHLEIESATSLTEVRKKIGYYYPNIRSKHNRPVTTLALYLRVGLAGQGWDEYVEEDEELAQTEEEVESEELYHVRWRYVGLPALPAERYLTSDNWLGVALSALMKIEPERKAWLRAEILRRLATECQENDYRKLLLINCAETYLPLEGAGNGVSASNSRGFPLSGGYEDDSYHLRPWHGGWRSEGKTRGSASNGNPACISAVRHAR